MGSNWTSVLRIRADCGGRLFTAKLGVVVHNLAHQLLNHLLADDALVSSATVFATASITSFASSVSTLSEPAVGYSAKKSSLSSTMIQWQVPDRCRESSDEFHETSHFGVPAIDGAWSISYVATDPRGSMSARASARQAKVCCHATHARPRLARRCTGRDGEAPAAVPRPGLSTSSHESWAAISANPACSGLKQKNGSAHGTGGGAGVQSG